MVLALCARAGSLKAGMKRLGLRDRLAPGFVGTHFSARHLREGFLRRQQCLADPLRLKLHCANTLQRL